MDTENHDPAHSGGADLTSGPIVSQLWALAWPMMLSMFFYTFYNLVDAYWVSKLSADAIAAVSISQITLFLMISLGFGINVGSGVVMSMDIGAKNKQEAERVLGQSFVLSAILAAFFTVIAILFREQLLTLSGATGDIFEPALSYFTVTSAGAVFMFLLGNVMFAFNSQGDTFTMTKLFAVSTFINLVLDPLFIFGWGPFPQMGIAGAAYATLISQAVLICIGFYALSRPKRTVQFHLRNLCFRWESVKQVLAIGVPAALTQLVNPLGIAALTFIASHAFAEAGAIAFSLGFRVEFFAYLPAVGFGFSAMAIIGQCIGAKKLERAQEVFRKALYMGVGVALVLGILVALFAGGIINVFTSDPVVVQYTQWYMRTVALSYGFLAAMMIEASVFQGLGRSWPGFFIQCIRFLLISIPLSYLFASVLGTSILGIWGAVVAGNIVAAIVGYFWIQKQMKSFNFAAVEETVHSHG